MAKNDLYDYETGQYIASNNTDEFLDLGMGDRFLLDDKTVRVMKLIKNHKNGDKVIYIKELD